MLAALLLLLAGSAVHAAEPPTLKDGELLRGRFVQERHLKGFDKPARSEGSFVLAPGRGLIWRGETPFAITTAITPAGIVQAVEGQETMRLSAARVPFLARLYDMMSGAMEGDWQGLESDFVVARSPGTVTLTPRRRDDGQPIRGITARLGRFVEAVEILRPDGDRDHLTFRDQTVTAAPLSAEETAVFARAGR